MKKTGKTGVCSGRKENCKTGPKLSKSPAFFGIMGEQLRAPLKSFDTIVFWDVRGYFRGFCICYGRKQHCKLGPTLRKLVFYFLSHWIGYDRGDSFSFNFEQNWFPFGSKSKGKLSPRSYPIQCERKCKRSFLGVGCPRGWCLSAYWGANWEPPLKPSIR